MKVGAIRLGLLSKCGAKRERFACVHINNVHKDIITRSYKRQFHVVSRHVTTPLACGHRVIHGVPLKVDVHRDETDISLAHVMPAKMLNDLHPKWAASQEAPLDQMCNARFACVSGGKDAASAESTGLQAYSGASPRSAMRAARLGENPSLDAELRVSLGPAREDQTLRLPPRQPLNPMFPC